MIDPRSPAAIQQLERLQAQQVDQAGRPTPLVHDPRVLREIAQHQLMAERLAERPSTGVDQMTAALVELVGRPDYEASVDARADALRAYYLETDGDLWSRYERPDHRKRLASLVVRVERAAGQRGYAIPRRPVVGTLGTRDMNAKAISGPPGEGHIVVFESGMFVFTSLLAKVAAQAIDAQLDPQHGAVVFRGGRVAGDHIARMPQILTEFVDLVFSQAVLGTCSFAVYEPPPQIYTPMAERFQDTIEVFVLAHEYAHVILGHADVPEVHDPGSGRSARDQEYEADHVALVIGSSACHEALWAYLGARLFLTAGGIIARAQNTFMTGDDAEPTSPSHPGPAERREALRVNLARIAAPDRREFGERMADAAGEILEKLWAFWRPAFERAYREGYPPPGYQPADELEKAAALASFMGTGVARR